MVYKVHDKLSVLRSVIQLYTHHIYIYTHTSAYVIATPVSAARLFSALFAILG